MNLISEHHHKFEMREYHSFLFFFEGARISFFVFREYLRITHSLVANIVYIKLFQLQLYGTRNFNNFIPSICHMYHLRCITLVSYIKKYSPMEDFFFPNIFCLKIKLCNQIIDI